ncbi:MAG: hypothetical protein V3S16_05945 [Candidatus Desulfatibia sp.]|uniref:hypothetical protein n=1 Tax=Candidatus Desulfatibia sp. TaxID=3101189 RepID=UPI002F3202D2
MRIIALKAVRIFPFAALFVILWYIPSAQAVPTFSKKYSAPCTLCHSSWPKLNYVGFQFMINGFQLPDSQDGSKAGKVSPTFDINLDTGDANPPFSLRFDGGLGLSNTPEGPGGQEATGIGCCTNGSTVELYAAGTVARNAGYYLSYPLGDQEAFQPEQAFIRFANIFGPGYMGFDLGIFRTSGFDAIVPHREWFGDPNPAYYGTSSLGGRDKGVTSAYVDTGIRLFGNPNYGIFSYDVVYVTGARTSQARNNAGGSGFGAMGRMDYTNYSASLRVWNAETGEVTFNRSSGGFFTSNMDGDGDFTGNPVSPDEKTMDVIFSFKYEREKWQLEFVYDKNTFGFDQRTDLLGNTYSSETITRNGYSAAAIFRPNSTVALGVRYGTSKVGAYVESYNGTTSTVPESSAGQLDFKFEIMPVQNARLGLQLSFDISNQQARLDEDGNKYGLQNKLVLLWDWAI